ncbi:MAG TPA: flagellar hook-associated protein FlgL, partial [Pseudomonadales bacterium]|nr:flagellar hook-associated protein FlgL [Pseudomonadales bacterium]
MRISTTMIFRQGVENMQRITSSNVKTQEQLSTGLKVNSPEDDPVAMTQILRLQDEVGSIEQYQKNVDLAQNRLSLEDTTLQSVNDVINRVRELATSANNGSIKPEDRRNIAVEVRERLKQLQDLLNTRDASGEYVFAGFKGDTKPFVSRADGGFEYKGDDGQRFIKVAAANSVAINDSGKSIFVDIQSAQKTFSTKAAPTNSTSPQGYISAGRVFDQDKYDATFPQDYIIQFQPLANSTPAGLPNFSVVRKSDGQPVTGTSPATALTNITYTPGQTLQFNGIEVSLNGAPQPGDAYLVEASNTQDLLTSVDKLAYALENLNNDSVFTTDGQTVGVATAASTSTAGAGNGIAGQVLTLRDDLDVNHNLTIPANASAKQIAQLVSRVDGVTTRFPVNSATLNIAATTTAPGDTI